MQHARVREPTITEVERDYNGTAGQKIHIRLKSYDHEVINNATKELVDEVTRAGATVVGPMSFPTEENVFCVVRSPHKYKDSHEHLEMCTYKWLIDTANLTLKTIDALRRFDPLTDMNVEIKL